MLYNNLVASRAHIVISIRVHGGSFDERKIKIKKDRTCEKMYKPSR